MKRSDCLALIVLGPLAWALAVRPAGRVAHGAVGHTAGGAVTRSASLSAPADIEDAGALASAEALVSGQGELASRERAHVESRGAWGNPEAFRRLHEGAPGTYIGDILADHDSALARWHDRRARPLVVWVQPEPAVWDFDPGYVTEVRSAFREWEATRIPVRFAFTGDSARADVHVTWTERFNEPISGKTIWSRDDEWWIVDADIVLAVHHASGELLDASAVHAIALHEVGHLIGLDHTSDVSTIMTPRVRVRALTEADRATAQLLYTLPPGPVRRP
jgi:hypothetical protein